MLATNIVSRQLGVEVRNYGFSGNGKMELNVTRYIANYSASAYVIDCLHNMDAEMVSPSLDARRGGASP